MVGVPFFGVFESSRSSPARRLVVRLFDGKSRPSQLGGEATLLYEAVLAQVIPSSVVDSPSVRLQWLDSSACHAGFAEATRKGQTSG
jgi:hypothetical protein